MSVVGITDFTGGMAPDRPDIPGSFQRAVDCQISSRGHLEQRGAKLFQRSLDDITSWTPSTVAGFGIHPSFSVLNSVITLTDEFWYFNLNKQTTGGWYRFWFSDDSHTAMLPWNASAAALRNALEACLAIGPGNLRVTGSWKTGFVIRFVGALAGTNINIIAWIDAELENTEDLDGFTFVQVDGGSVDASTPNTFTTGVISSVTGDDGIHRLVAAAETDTNWVNMGNLYRTGAGTTAQIPVFSRFIPVGGEMIGLQYASSSVGTQPVKWGGATKDSYGAGTVAVTAGQNIVTGTGTAWAANLAVGMYINIDTPDLATRFMRITDVVSDTEIRVDAEIKASGTAMDYRAISFAPLKAMPSGLFGGGIPRMRAVAGHQGRLIAGNLRDDKLNRLPDRIAISGLASEQAHDAATIGDQIYKGSEFFHIAGYIDVAPGVGGKITALASFNNVLIVLKSEGVMAVRGTLAGDGSDLGASVDILTDVVGNIGDNSWDRTAKGIVFADRNGAYITNGYEVKSLTEGTVQKWWRDKGMGITGMTVSSLPNRIVFHGARTMIFDITTESWWEQEHGSYSRIIIGEDGKELSMISIGEHAADMVDWRGDWQEDRSRASFDHGYTNRPYMQATTNPIPLTKNPSDEAVINRWTLHCSSDKTGPLVYTNFLYGMEASTSQQYSEQDSTVPITPEVADRPKWRRTNGTPTRHAVRIQLAAPPTDAMNARITVYDCMLDVSSTSKKPT